MEEDTEGAGTLVKLLVELAKKNRCRRAHLHLLKILDENVNTLPVDLGPTSSQPVNENIIVNRIAEEVTGPTFATDGPASRILRCQSAYLSRVFRRHLICVG